MLVVTGGGGFIGSAMVWALNEAGRADIVIVDRFGRDAKWRNIAKRDFVEIVAIDKLAGWLEQHGREVDAVFHLGANASTTETDADLIIETNLNASIALWRWCAANGKPLIYASSAATYGDGSHGFDDGGGLEELKRLRPMNLYAWSKHAFDLWALREAAKGHAPPRWAGLKFFNVFGPNEYHKDDMQSLVAKNYPRIAAGETVRLFKSHRRGIADGEQKRDFVYVKDCVAVMLWLWRQGSAAQNGIRNLGTGTARSFRELIEATAAACGQPARIDYVETPLVIRASYQYLTEARMDWLHAAGYNRAFAPLEAAVNDFVTGYLATPDPYL